MGARFDHDTMSGYIDQTLNTPRYDHVFLSGQLTFDHQGRSDTSVFVHG
jgi:hypothetical protein